MSSSLAPLDTLSESDCRQLRLIASDMDGTLSQDGKFRASLLGALERLQAALLPVVIVTGRSAGWVQAIAQYLPVMGAIAENGGLFYGPPHFRPEFWVEMGQGASEISDGIPAHRQRLAQTFTRLQAAFPDLRESTDNRFRLTDWTFDVAGLDAAALEELQALCHIDGWDFTYSTVQCHIRLPGQDKAIALQHLAKRLFPAILPQHPQQILTVGDSPNDASLFNPQTFPLSVGVANVRHYVHALPHSPRYVTQAAEGEGFCELTDYVLAARLDETLA